MYLYGLKPILEDLYTPLIATHEPPSVFCGEVGQEHGTSLKLKKSGLSLTVDDINPYSITQKGP